MRDWHNAPPLDLFIQRQVEDAIAQGYRLPRWGWPTPRAYNGSSGMERIAGWQKVRIAERLGLITRADCCSVCHEHGAEHFHAEIYLRCLAVRPVCRSCHYRIHKRFNDPDPWRSLLDRHARPGDWAACLRITELRREEAERIAAAPDVFVALAERYSSS